MLNYIKKLDDSEFLDLLVAVGEMRYGDDSCRYEYFDKETVRVVNLERSGGSFKDYGRETIWINDIGTSKHSINLNHYIFMLEKFGESWFKETKRHFEANEMRDCLEILDKAKAQYEKDLEADKEFMESLEG